MSALAFAAIFLLPGVPIAFSPLFRSLDGWIRLLFAVALSVPAASLEYLLLRGAGIGPDPAVTALWLVNLPSLALLWRARASFAWPGAARATSLAAAILVPVMFLALVFLRFDEKAFWGHSWLHAEMIYALRDNVFAPEESQLAGLEATYPWLGHIFFLISSTALGQSPLQSWVWINLVLAALFGGLAMIVVRAFGGGFAAVLVAPFLFAFAANPVGVAGARIMAAIGQPVRRWAYLMGDPRHDFVLIKHMRLNLNQVAITLVIALLFLAIRPCPATRGRAMAEAAAIAVMVFAVSAIYPIYLPVALTLSGARIAALVLVSRAEPARAAALALALATALAAVAAWFAVTLPLGPRTTGLGLDLSVPGAIWRHAVMTAIAVSLPALAMALTLRRRLHDAPLATTVLCLTAVGCGLLAVFLHIPNRNNEYKFVFPAALALMPFLCLGLERLVARGRLAVPVSLAALCLYGATDSALRREIPPGVHLPRLVYSGLAQDLGPEEPIAAALKAIRLDAPAGAVLVAGDTELSLPALTGHPIHVPADPDRAHPGMTFANDFLLAAVKGYDQQMILARRADLMALLDGPAAARTAALGRILALGRPVVILADIGGAPDLVRWLEAGGAPGTALHRDSGWLVWVVPAKGDRP